MPPRQHAYLLSQPLNPGNAEAGGQEYQRTLDEHGEVETYLQSYVALLADRGESMVNEPTFLAAHDVREKTAPPYPKRQ